jgi:hypothetical protein
VFPHCAVQDVRRRHFEDRSRREINVLDPGGFGGVTITKSISIISTTQAGVLVSGSNGIVVNVAAGDTVLLGGLDIEGLGTSLNGVQIIGGGRTLVRKCSIRNFTQSGVNLVGTNARVVIADSLLLRNGTGLNVQAPVAASNFAAVQNTLIDLSTSTATHTPPAAYVRETAVRSRRPTRTVAGASIAPMNAS